MIHLGPFQELSWTIFHLPVGKVRQDAVDVAVCMENSRQKFLFLYMQLKPGISMCNPKQSKC